MEELLTIPINEDGSRFFLVGSSLIHHECEQLVSFLKDNIEVFALTLYEMAEVDPRSFAMNRTSTKIDTWSYRMRGDPPQYTLRWSS